MKTAHPYIAFTLTMTGIIATMCILLTQIKATYRDEAQPRLRQSQAAGCESTLVNIDIG